MPAQSSNLRRRIERVFALADGSDSDEIRSELACHICVLTSGYIEERVREIVVGYCARHASPAIVEHIRRNLHRFRNAKMEKILELVAQFDSQLRDSIELKAGDEMKDAIDSIVSNKNTLAHGQNSGLGLETMRDYYHRAVRLIAIVEREFR